MADDLLGLGKVCEALEKGTKEVRELAKMYFKPIAKEKGELRADKIRLERMHQTFKTMEEADRLCKRLVLNTDDLTKKLSFLCSNMPHSKQMNNWQ